MHELRQPLIDIRDSLVKYREYPNVFPIDVVHERMLFSAEFALLLTENMTLASLPDEKLIRGMKNSKRNLDLKSYLHDVKNMLRSLCDDYRFRSDNIEIQVDDHFRNVQISRNVIGEIVINLLSNAIKYSTHNSESSYCTIKISKETSEFNTDLIKVDCCDYGNSIFLLAVADNGIGIPKNEQKNIFKRGYRLERTVAPGLGLGLYSVKRLVDALGGWIWIESEPNLRINESKNTTDIYNTSTKIFVALPEREVR